MSDPNLDDADAAAAAAANDPWRDRKDVPDADAQVPEEAEPETQENDPLIADLGEDGQGDLSPEDEPGAGTDDPGPTDLRTEAP